MGALFGGGGGAQLGGGGQSMFGPGSANFDRTNPNLGSMAQASMPSFMPGMRPSFGPGSANFDPTNAAFGGGAASLQNALLGNRASVGSPISAALATDESLAPKTGSAAIGALSSDRNERIAQIVEASKQTYGPESPLAKLASSQALLESGMLNNPHGLASKYNNLFGIKGSGTAGSVNMMTKEFVDGKMQRMQQQFAHNKSLNDSFAQHRQLLNNPRYKNVLQATSFEEAAKAIKDAGYATDPNYTQLLMKIYNNNLSNRF